MAGPGSRVEKFGTIFTRVTGLLRSGALKEENKPIWYDVYAAFPPKSSHASQAQDEAAREPPNILYLEDLVRAKFYKTYGNPGVIDMRNEQSTPHSQKFVDKYFELDQQGVERGEIFKAAAEALATEGIHLRSLADIDQAKKEAAAQREKMKSRPEQLSMETESSETLSRSPAAMAAAEDTIDEDLVNPADPKELR